MNEPELKKLGETLEVASKTLVQLYELSVSRKARLNRAAELLHRLHEYFVDKGQFIVEDEEALKEEIAEYLWS